MFWWSSEIRAFCRSTVLQDPIFASVSIEEADAPEVSKYDPISALIPFIYLLLILAKK